MLDPGTSLLAGRLIPASATGDRHKPKIIRQRAPVSWHAGSSGREAELMALGAVVSPRLRHSLQNPRVSPCLSPCCMVGWGTCCYAMLALRTCSSTEQDACEAGRSCRDFEEPTHQSWLHLQPERQRMNLGGPCPTAWA